MFLLWLRQLPWCGDQTPISVTLPTEDKSRPTNTLVFPLVHPTKFCMVLYILFLWSGTPVHSQLVFCMHFCVWRCIPNVSVQRVVLHIHLLLRHLVLLPSLILFWITFFWCGCFSKSSTLNIGLSKWYLPVSLLHFIFQLSHLYPTPLLSSRLDFQSSKHFYILQIQSAPKPHIFRGVLSLYISCWLPWWLRR